MDKFPDWAQSLLAAADSGPRPHALNLALKLADPCKLPLMLLDVVAAQPTIDRALKDLAFLHFARFVPSWDGSALMVTTEFDGPIQPYVMDFVIALGDVFNKLLAYVEEPPPLPVQQYPDEFWAYVEKWNRVPFAPRSDGNTGTVLPAGFDYPLYCAYPNKSVADIKGPRDPVHDGLRPALDRQAVNVDRADVQGNILRGYPAVEAWQLMLCVTDAALARAWLAQQPVQDDQNWAGKAPEAAPLNVAFTFEGLCALLPARAADLARFPEAFREGAAARAPDNGDRGDSAPGDWRFGGPRQQAVHVVLSMFRLRNVDKAVFDKAYADLRHEAQNNGLAFVHEEQAKVLRSGRIYFGYRDGLTAPRIAGQCPVQGERLGMQPASSPGEFLLGKDYQNIYGGESLGRHMPPDLASNGCFGALRLIEQDVVAFARLRRDLAHKFHVTPGEAGARLLGRWREGQPLSLDPRYRGPPPNPKDKPRNDFDYAPNWEYPQVPVDHDGRRCPLDAHIRRTNPRSHHAPGMRHTRRLIRRGMPATWRSPDGKLHGGLLGLFLCGDLERQFEFIQRQWVQGGEGGHSDAISGVRSGKTPFRWSTTAKVDIPPLVYTRGCLYLFYPGLTMLRRLPALAGAEPSWPAQLWLGLKNFARQIVARIKAVPRLPPQVCEFVTAWLVRHVLPSRMVADFAKGLLPRLPDLGDLPKTQAHDVDALATHFIVDPCKTYERLRGQGKDFFWEPSHQAFWALRREDVSRIVQNDQEFVQVPEDDKKRGIISLDGEKHCVVRKAFWESLRAPMTAVSANLDTALQAQLGKLGGLKQFDFVRDLSNPVLTEVFWKLFGLPSEHQQACSAHAAMAMRQFSQPGPRRSPGLAAGGNASVRLWGQLAVQLALAVLWDLLPLVKSPYAGTLLGGVAARTQLPLLSWLGLSGRNRTMDFMTAATSLLQFVLAGHLAPQLLLSSATRNFLAHEAAPGTSVWTHLAALAPAARKAPLDIALDEARRFDPPVTIMQRYTRGSVTIRGLELPADTPVFAVVASANRDDPAAANLDQFIWDRTDAPAHFSLGAGPHRCIGKAVQRMMVPQMLSTLMAAMPELRLVDPAAVPAWIDNIYFRGLESLPVTTCPLSHDSQRP